MIALVIEDDPFNGSSMAAQLLARGHLAGWAQDARGALARLRVTRPDAALLDWCLPDADGRTLLRTLRERCSRVVVLTALSLEEIRRLAEEFPDVPFVQKPADPEAVIRLMEGR